MMYYLFYNIGNCIYQDHEVDLEEFKTLEEAKKKTAEINKRGWDVTLICGEEVKLNETDFTK